MVCKASHKIANEQAVMMTIDTVSPCYPISIVEIARQVFQTGIVKFVCGNVGAYTARIIGRRGPRPFSCFLKHHVAPALRAIFDDDIARYRPNHVELLIPPLDAARQVHQPPTLYVRGHALPQSSPDVCKQTLICRQACQMTLDLFEYSIDDMIEGPELGGAATYIECATQSDINLFI